MKDKGKTDQKKNQGFSLLAVIVAVSFIGILGLLMIYMALSNFQMKVTDLKGKDSFYTAEQALEEIRTGLQQDVGDAMSKAYIQILESYNNKDSSDIVLDKQRQSDFEDAFIAELARRLKGESLDYYNMDYLRKYVDMERSSTFDQEKETLIVTNPDGKSPVMKKDKKSGVLLRNLKVIYVDARGYASIIETDIQLGIPKVQFPTPSTLPDLMNMLIVADSGIICEAQAGKTTTIDGSVYSGILQSSDALANASETSIWVKTGGNLRISSGDKVVSEGEVKVDENSNFTSASGVSLWAEGITLASANVNLLGTTYLSDDLTVENGNSSNVTISGNYYGYGYPTSAKQSENLYRYEGVSDAALSSAIVINGKNTTLNLSGVQRLMIAGKNYIGSSQVKSSSGTGTMSGRANSDVMTGESITVKGTQLAYLLPAELISVAKKATDSDTTEITVRNPMTYEEYESYGFMRNGISVKMDTPVEKWGGKTLRQAGVDESKPVQEVFYNNNADQGYVYVYLNFTSDSAAASFMYDYYHNNPAVKNNLDSYLSFYFGEDGSGVSIKDKQSFIRYVTNGNVLQYEKNADTVQADIKNATNSNVSEKFLQEQVNYQNTWYALNRKMITSVDLLNKEVKGTDGKFDHDETDSSRSVFDNLVNEPSMKAFLRERASGTLKYEFTSSADDEELRAIMYDNGPEGRNTELVIDQTEADKLRLVVCTGDVRIRGDVYFQGIIMAKGKITLEAGAAMTSSPLQAAKVFQAQMASDENMSPKDFFWEGDKYVLGNTTTFGDNQNSGYMTDTYDLADCVTYQNWRKE